MTTGGNRSRQEFAGLLTRSRKYHARTGVPGTADPSMVRRIGPAEPSRKVPNRPEGLPSGFVIGVKLLLVAGAIAILVLGPAYYACQTLAWDGRVYDATIGRCMQGRVSENVASVEGFLRGLTAGR